MTDKIISVSPSDNLSHASALLKKHGVGCLPVCDNKGQLCGIVTDRDIVTRGLSCGENPAKCEISEIMTTGVVTVSPSAKIEDATKVMSSEKVRRVPVVLSNKLVGMLSLGDIAKTHSCNMEVSEALGDISKEDINTSYLK